MRTLELSTEEYALIMQPLIHAADYIKHNTELGKQIAQAIQILKKSSKGNAAAVPSGGSSYLSREQKIKDLFQTFGIDKRINL